MITLLVAKNEYLRSLKSKKKLCLMFLLPLIAIVLAVGTNNLMKPSINIGIIENEHSHKGFKEKINNINRVKASFANKETINTDMILAKYLGVIEFKEDNKYKVHCLDKSAKVNIESAISEIIINGKTEKMENIISTLEKGSLSAAERSSGFILITLIMTCTISASAMLKDKENRILTRYAVSPNKLYSYVLGSYIYNIINTVFQVIISALLIYLLKIDIGVSVNQFIIIGAIISTVSSSIAALVTLLSKSELQASLLGSSMALLMALLGGAFLPVEKMPDLLKFISNISVTKWIIEITSFMENGVVSFYSLTLIMFVLSISIGMLIISLILGEKRLR